MAKVLAEFTFPERIPFAGRESKYHWPQWFDGQKWCLTQGEDFDIGPKQMRSQAGTKASAANIVIKCCVDGPNLIVQKIRDQTPEEIAAKKERRKQRLAASGK